MKSTFSFIIFSLLLLSCDNISDNNSFPVYPNEKSRTVDSLLLSLQKAEKFNGNVLIAQNDTILLLNTYGYSNLGKATKLKENSIFRLASITKQFTALAILQLHNDGLLSISHLVSDYIPELSHYDKINIEHLIMHTSGLPDYAELAEKYWDKSKAASNQDILNLFKEYEPKVYFEPNEKWSYSNTGYIFLACIIEKATGESFQSFIENKILKPNK